MYSSFRISRDELKTMVAPIVANMVEEFPQKNPDLIKKFVHDFVGFCKYVQDHDRNLSAGHSKKEEFEEKLDTKPEKRNEDDETATNKYEDKRFKLDIVLNPLRMAERVQNLIAENTALAMETPIDLDKGRLFRVEFPWHFQISTSCTVTTPQDYLFMHEIPKENLSSCLLLYCNFHFNDDGSTSSVKPKGTYLGYRANSPIRGAVFSLNFEGFKPYDSPEKYAEALSNGSVSALVGEVPYIKILIANYPDDYSIKMKPMSAINGFGFVCSKALAASEDSEKDPHSLNLDSYWGLFLVSGISLTFALFFAFSIKEKMDGLKDYKIAQLIIQLQSMRRRRHISSAHDLEEPIIWLGGSLISTRGRAMISTSKMKLRIGVPGHNKFKGFVELIKDLQTNLTVFSGFCIEAFMLAIRKLPYPVEVEFIPYGGTYNDLVYQVYLRDLSHIVHLKNMQKLYPKGSKHGGVSAIVDEVPYIKQFVAKYPGDYSVKTMPMSNTNGFGYAFLKGSALVHDISKELSKLKEAGELAALEKKWTSSRAYREEALLTPFDDSADDPHVLSLDFFGGLFLISGISSALALLLFFSFAIKEKTDFLKYGNIVQSMALLQSVRKYLFNKVSDGNNYTSA
ncbi:hypothetical protein FEM48_Zijuj07G0059600 [Ziziphus jujuba var. spinosa]|uniref:Ionotropic glutamate receptor C-terminal domain-containing protein n=1 Tax=Ziziphus jujuba var. spinosa TaxID=714518 RepID=A0A978V2V7_ZIZJJ|nr:hypothetical protein FEM48_Zijuj07G0059600 [Ziziphus jujuba var. spinosa]